MRFLKNVIVHIEDGPQTFGIRPQDFARTHKISSARILARLGFEEGKRYLRRTYVQTPFKRIHPESEDIPRNDTTANLYRLVRKETKDGAETMLYFVRIMKGLHPEYKPHLRMAAAKELVRQIEFDYEDSSADTPTPTPEPTPAADATRPEPTEETTAASTESTEETFDADAAPSTDAAPDETAAPTPTTAPALPEPTSETQPTSASPANPVNPSNPINPDSETATSPKSNSNPQPTNPVNPSNPINPDSDKNTNQANPLNPTPNPYRDYAAQRNIEEESIFHAIIRRASYCSDLPTAEREARETIAEFDQFMAERDSNYQPVAVPDELITKSLNQRMNDPESYFFDPAEYYDLDRDDFYYCFCRRCEECDELDYFFEFMRELHEETDHLFEDP